MTHCEMLRLWPNRTVLARAIAEAGGMSAISHATVQSWELRNNIPENYWAALVIVARRDKIKGITVSALRAASDARRAALPPRKNARKIPASVSTH